MGIAAATASADTLSITFQDFGGARAKVSDVSPTSIETGTTSAVVCTGNLSEDVTGASFDTTIKASGVTVASCNGDASKDVVCKLPLGVGAITLKATTFPLKADTVKINTEVQLSSLVPASLASTDIHIEGTADSGDKLVCLDLHGQKQATLAEIAESVNAAGLSWKAEAPEKFASLEDVSPFLGAFLPGDAQYEEPEVADIPAINAALPDSFDSAENWPQCSVIGNVRDQSSCGSCWAFGSVSSFESRACISTGNDVKYSPEDTAFCSNAGYGCQGGNSAWNYFSSTGVVTGGDYTDIGSRLSVAPTSAALSRV